jgi:hypothetical protein
MQLSQAARAFACSHNTVQQTTLSDAHAATYTRFRLAQTLLEQEPLTKREIAAKQILRLPAEQN